MSFAWGSFIRGSIQQGRKDLRIGLPGFRRLQYPMSGQLEVQAFFSYAQDAARLGGPGADFDAIDGLDGEVNGLDVGPAAQDAVSYLPISVLDDARVLS